jgi:hypothetical protein
MKYYVVTAKPLTLYFHSLAWASLRAFEVLE